MTGIRLISFREYRKGSLVGFCEVEVPAWGMTLFDLGLYEKGDERWVQPAGKPRLDRDGRVMVTPNGTKVYDPIIRFTRVVQDRLSAAVWEAVEGQLESQGA